jgi:uncharacterized membrane protein YedE/YeeE
VASALLGAGSIVYWAVRSIGLARLPKLLYHAYFYNLYSLIDSSMTIDTSHFTPYASLAGGALIGAAAALLVLGAGRLLGAVGIFAGALETRGAEGAWRLWLIAGIVAAPAVAHVLWAQSAPVISAGVLTLVVAGLLVGFGARLGSGCTSGHGVCGIARLSPRSLVATMLFMASGFATVFLVRHVLV